MPQPAYQTGISVLLEDCGVLVDDGREGRQVPPSHASDELQVRLEVLDHASLEKGVAGRDLPGEALDHDKELVHDHTERKSRVCWGLTEAQSELGESLSVFQAKRSDPPRIVEVAAQLVVACALGEGGVGGELGGGVNVLLGQVVPKHEVEEGRLHLLGPAQC